MTKVVEVRGLVKQFEGGRVHAVDGIDLATEEGEYLVLLGPSGCGKTTLLRIISGLMTPTSGSVTLDGVPVESVPEDLTLVFQDYRRSLYPWLRVDANVEFPLRYSGIDKRERAERVRQALLRLAICVLNRNAVSTARGAGMPPLLEVT